MQRHPEKKEDGLVVYRRRERKTTQCLYSKKFTHPKIMRRCQESNPRLIKTVLLPYRPPRFHENELFIRQKINSPLFRPWSFFFVFFFALGAFPQTKNAIVCSNKFLYKFDSYPYKMVTKYCLICVLKSDFHGSSPKLQLQVRTIQKKRYTLKKYLFLF